MSIKRCTKRFYDAFNDPHDSNVVSARTRNYDVWAVKSDVRRKLGTPPAPFLKRCFRDTNARPDITEMNASAIMSPPLWRVIAARVVEVVLRCGHKTPGAAQQVDVVSRVRRHCTEII